MYISSVKVCVTGGAGFIGANLVEHLLADGNEVIVIDDFSTGDERFLSPDIKRNIELVRQDLSRVESSSLARTLKQVEVVFHLAANADVRGGWNATFTDIQQNVIATHNVAVAARSAGVNHLVFASTGCVYGDSTLIPTPEDEPFPTQTSLYGASKVAAEGILSTFAMNDAFSVTVFRFVSVLGKYYHHGHVIDFMRQLFVDPSLIRVLGNGRQRKSFISVEDCVRAIMSLRGSKKFEVFNIGQSSFCEIQDSAKLIAATMGLKPRLVFGAEDRGWIGDNPFTFLDTKKANDHGWVPLTSIEASISQTVDWISENKWVITLDDSRRKLLSGHS
jgi:UDP-glucose 4-epimerase